MPRIGTILAAVLLLPSVAAAQPFSPDWKSAWPHTDFSRRSVDLSSIEPGGPPRDGIPSIDHPRFVSVEEASDWIADREPVIFLELNEDVHAYPLQIMIWHEIVNDTVGGIPVAVTFCPLCYTAIAFDRRINGRVYDFGTSGLLRHSDLVMYDRQTESLWQQLSGEAIVGEMVDHTLKMISAPLISFGRFKLQHPGANVLSRETGYRRSYGDNPYAGYDDLKSKPSLYKGPLPKKVQPMEHLVTVMINGEPVAYPYSFLGKRPVVNDTVSGVPIVVFYEKTTGTALGRRKLNRSKAIGAGEVFDRRAVCGPRSRLGLEHLWCSDFWAFEGKETEQNSVRRFLCLCLDGISPRHADLQTLALLGGALEVSGGYRTPVSATLHQRQSFDTLGRRNLRLAK